MELFVLLCFYLYLFCIFSLTEEHGATVSKVSNASGPWVLIWFWLSSASISVIPFSFVHFTTDVISWSAAYDIFAEIVILFLSSTTDLMLYMTHALFIYIFFLDERGVWVETFSEHLSLLSLCWKMFQKLWYFLAFLLAWKLMANSGCLPMIKGMDGNSKATES